jgi:hypothetical protein
MAAMKEQTVVPMKTLFEAATLEIIICGNSEFSLG